jgi:acyl carrier protein
MNPLHDRLQRVFREVFENEKLVVDDALSPATLSDWDSFAQVRLMIELEEEFGVQFTTDEAVAAQSVPAITALIAAKR